MPDLKTLYVSKRADWRAWLEKNFDREKEIWLVYPKKSSGRPCILYNDAVEEALCFGWIDSQYRPLDEYARLHRYSPRRPGSKFSQQNRERLAWLLEHGMLHPSVVESAREVLSEPFVFPQDIIEAIKADKKAWEYYQTCSDAYKRIRVAWIEAGRKRPEVFRQRLEHFLRKTRERRRIGYGGIEKYY
jgi:uncharacterized protein YdeI (YjbR/CyaY-like superfamily)